jgi:sugar (pentulose or hexulose) kinase
MPASYRDNDSGRLVLAIDFGTSHLKIAVYDVALNVMHTSLSSTQTLSGSRQGQIDPAALWLVMRDQIAEVGSYMDLQRIGAIGITGMAESGCLISRNDQPLTPMLLWHDRRGIRQAVALRRRAGGTFARITGLRMTSVRSIAKWRWMVDHGASREARWCGGPEWIALRLTGCWQTDPTLAVRTGAFDVLQGEYSNELLDLAGAPRGLFPPVHGSPSNAGPILPEIGRDLGLPLSVHVVIAGHDDIASAYGVGGQMGDLIDSGGTAEGLVRIVESPPDPAETVNARMAMTSYYRPGTWALIAGAGSTGALMQQVAQLLGKEPAVLDEQAAPPGKYEAGTIEVRLSKEGLPTIRLHPKATEPQVWSAVLDLVCERVAQTAARLERLTGPPSRLILIGGAARSHELSKRKANLFGLPTAAMAEVDASTRGAAALASLACGWTATSPTPK